MLETYPKKLSERLSEDYERQQALFSAQPAIVQRYLETQGKQIAQAVVDGDPQINFSLPDRVICTLENVDQPALVTIPQNQRTRSAGSFINRFRKTELYKELRHAFIELEQSPDRAVSVAAGLLRHATVMHMVSHMLPAGRTVCYTPAEEDESIPFIPEDDGLEPESAITAATDAIAEEGNGESGRGNLLVPFVPYARKFFLPQWVAFGEHGEMLVKSVDEANAHIKSMQRFMEVLFLAVALAPYISIDEEYAKKRYGMLGQLVNQGRALAIYQVKEIINRIKQRAEAGSLNRGLRLSLPYFDDQDLKLAISHFEVIPSGRIMFVPGFVVRAVRQEEVKVSQDTRYSSSTRKHLLYLLDLLEKAFEAANL
ncbi:MAG: hypothetical protein EHM33_24440 [Chloroflexi bacterium]|nr:MAG: hypothetical protein EHM33_24440 [Chloroflexota bacterium]